MALQIDIKAVVEEGQEHLATRPCVDCGLVTGSYCDKCLAKDRMASEEWIPNQSTPLCTFCDSKWAGVWDRLVEYIDDELGNIQALRVVSRAFVSKASTATLCHLAFHEIDILLDPFSNPRAPIWTRCIALYSRVS